MKKNIILVLLAALVFSSCGGYNKVLKSTDYEFQYEAAKAYFAQGKYSKAASLLEQLVTILKGTDKAEESLYMLGMTYFNQESYDVSSHYFITYYKTYPRGVYAELARFQAGKALYLSTPEPRLDQSSTFKAIEELQLFIEYFPQSLKKQDAQNMIFKLQDKLVEKDYLSAKLYFDLGTYMGNNYQSCVVTAQNALRDYPYTRFREDLYILTLRAKNQIAVQSVEDKKLDRYREVIDEYYAFKNEFPESKYDKEAAKIFNEAKGIVKE